MISVSEEILQLSMNGSWMIDNIYTLDAFIFYKQKVQKEKNCTNNEKKKKKMKKKICCVSFWFL